MANNSTFAKCVLSYPEATMALAQFRDVVQQRCLATLDSYLDELYRVIGYKGDPSAPEGFSWPDRLRVDVTDFFEIGSRVILQGGKVEIGSRLFWECDGQSPEVGVSVYVRVKSAELRTQMMKELTAAWNDPRFRNQPWYLDSDTFPDLCLALKKSELASFDDHLERLLKWTIAAFESRPNVKRLVGKWTSAR